MLFRECPMKERSIEADIENHSRLSVGGFTQPVTEFQRARLVPLTSLRSGRARAAHFETSSMRCYSQPDDGEMAMRGHAQVNVLC